MGGSTYRPTPGDVISDKYRVERVLGTGGMGVVVAARHIELDELVALKFLLPEVADQPELRARFQREAKAAVRIKSQHVAHVLDIARMDPDILYIVMEYLEGEDLATYLAGHGPLGVAEALQLVLQACEGLAEAHALGIIHRDLKPSNLFLCDRADGRRIVKVMDFGISKVAAGLSLTADTADITHTGGMLGSPAYIAPEQIRNAKEADQRADVWSLGVILYELVSGCHPFGGQTVGGILGSILTDPAIPLRVAWPIVPQPLEDIVMRCVEKDPALRFQSVRQLADALRDLSLPSLPPAPPHKTQAAPDAATLALPSPNPVHPSVGQAAKTPSMVETPRPQPPRTTRRRPYAVIGILAALCTTLAIALFWRRSPPPSTPTAADSAPRQPSAIASIDLPEPLISATASAPSPIASPKIAPKPAAPATVPKKSTGPHELNGLIDERR